MNIDKLFDAKLGPIAREQAHHLGESWEDMDIYDISHAFVALKECYSEAISRLDSFDPISDWGSICEDTIS